MVKHLLLIKKDLIIPGGGNGPVPQVDDVRVGHPFFRILNGDGPGFSIRPGSFGPDVSTGIDEEIGDARLGKDPCGTVHDVSLGDTIQGNPHAGLFKSYGSPVKMNQVGADEI